jgi:DNA (cytosine-5)-methyltransferase 1
MPKTNYEVVNENILLIIVDSFCGGGGTTTGFHRAKVKDNPSSKVIIGINHDEQAIRTHAKNHPDTVHFIEDFTVLDPVLLLPIIEKARRMYPNAKLLFWASAECTHHSKAKGGMSRDADSRSLPEHIARYVDIINPDIIGIENVKEFVDWGPLEHKLVLNKAGEATSCYIDYKKDKKTKKVLSIEPVWIPIKTEKGTFFREWRDGIMELGYYYEHKFLNAADFGAFTSRERYFSYFAREKELIVFPEPTHSKSGGKGLKKWRPVKEVLNLHIHGESIFQREKPYVDATLERVTHGVLKYVVGKVPAPFLSLAYSGSPGSKVIPVTGPARTVTTVDHHQLVTAYYGNGYTKTVEEPCGTITTKDRFSLVTPQFLAMSYSGGGQDSPIDSPSPTITTVPKHNLVTPQFLDQQYGNSKPASIGKPIGTLTANPKFNLVTPYWLLNPQYDNKGSSIDKPCFTLIARMDKMPPYLMEAAYGVSPHLKIRDSDSPVMRKLKTICLENGIKDILMRMLFIDELLRIQGFGDGYQMLGTVAQQKKFIGNAVECTQAQSMAEALCNNILKLNSLRVK